MVQAAGRVEGDRQLSEIDARWPPLVTREG